MSLPTYVVYEADHHWILRAFIRVGIFRVGILLFENISFKHYVAEYLRIKTQQLLALLLRFSQFYSTKTDLESTFSKVYL